MPTKGDDGKAELCRLGYVVGTVAYRDIELLAKLPLTKAKYRFEEICRAAREVEGLLLLLSGLAHFHKMDLQRTVAKEEEVRPN